MHFAFTEDQRAITEAAREMLVESCTPADLRRLLASGEAIDAGRWQTIVDMGLLGIMAPEDRGGLGLGLIDLVGIAEAAGYVALPEPLVELAGVVVPLLAELEDDKSWLARALDGAIVGLHGFDAGPFIIDADIADGLLLNAPGGLHLIDPLSAKLVRQPSFDPFRRLITVDWKPTEVTLIDRYDATLASNIRLFEAMHRGQVLAAAQLIGLGQRCIDMAVAYAKDRHQFGKPIGSYQAVKHLLATAQVKIEFARPVVHAAAFAPTGDPMGSEIPRVAHAKLAAAEAADLAARTAVQVFGAMGMTNEADVHFFLKRVLALKTVHGTPAQHMASVIYRVLDLPTGPEFTFASEVPDPA